MPEVKLVMGLDRIEPTVESAAALGQELHDFMEGLRARTTGVWDFTVAATSLGPTQHSVAFTLVRVEATHEGAMAAQQFFLDYVARKQADPGGAWESRVRLSIAQTDAERAAAEAATTEVQRVQREAQQAAARREAISLALAIEEAKANPTPPS